MPVLGLQAVEAQTKNKARGRLCLFPLFLFFGCLYSRSCSTISMPGIGSLTISCSVANLSGQNRKDLPPPGIVFIKIGGCKINKANSTVFFVVVALQS